jgi:hypothetical protein
VATGIGAPRHRSPGKTATAGWVSSAWSLNGAKGLFIAEANQHDASLDFR